MAEYQVSSDADDGCVEGSLQFYDTIHYFGFRDDFMYYYDGWVRFTDVDLPQGVTIESAHLEFYGVASQTGACDITIEAQDEDDATQISSYIEYDNMTWTTSSVGWTVGDWSDNTWHQSPDISSVVQEVVDRSGWVSGNAMGFRIADLDSSSSKWREFDDYGDNPSGAPKLVVTADIPPVTVLKNKTTIIT